MTPIDLEALQALDKEIPSDWYIVEGMPNVISAAGGWILEAKWTRSEVFLYRICLMRNVMPGLLEELKQLRNEVKEWEDRWEWR